MTVSGLSHFDMAESSRELVSAVRGGQIFVNDRLCFEEGGFVEMPFRFKPQPEGKVEVAWMKPEFIERRDKDQRLDI